VNSTPHLQSTFDSVARAREDGIGLYGSSSDNIVSGNNIVNNSYGIWFYGGQARNWIYNNNFIDNTPQVYPSFYFDLWDAGYPSGGNYWSPQYKGAREWHPKETNPHQD
jgi:parallel beta-helix repeat protein